MTNIVSQYMIKNESAKINELIYVKDNGYLANNTTEYNQCTIQDMNSEILQFLHSYDCTVKSIGNTITVEQTFD